MYRHLEHRLARAACREFLRRSYPDARLCLKCVIEQPPKVELGEYALPLAFPFAKTLRKAPLKIAEEIRRRDRSDRGHSKCEVAAPAT